MVTVPNQRIIQLNKEICDKTHIFSTHNLKALDEAALRLQSKGGFKLYMYLAKNNVKKMPTLALSSTDFCAWSGLGIAAYRTAFNELVKEGYLIPKENTETVYSFYDKSQIENNNSIDNVTIEYPQVKEKEITLDKFNF